MIKICLDKNKARDYQLKVLFETNDTLTITFSEVEFLSLLALLRVEKNGYTINFHRWSGGQYSIEIEKSSAFHFDFFIDDIAELQKFINFEVVEVYSDSFKLGYYEENQWKIYSTLKTSLSI